MEKITLLVANFNCAKYVGECLSSIQNQTSSDWLCLVCDDASTDDSVRVIEPFLGEKIRLIRNKPNQGYTRTLKRMIEEATTDIVGIVDADDALEPNAVEQLMAAYRDSDYGFVYTDYQAFDEAMDQPVDDGGCGLVPEGKTALVYGFVSHLKSFRKSIYDQTDGYDECIFAEDRDLVYKMEEVTRLHFIDQKLYKHRVIPHSASRDQRKLAKGFFSHVVARRNALKRRGVRGVDRFVHGCLNASLWLCQMRWLRPVGKCMFHRLGQWIRSGNHRSGCLKLLDSGKA